MRVLTVMSLKILLIQFENDNMFPTGGTRLKHINFVLCQTLRLQCTVQ